MRQGTQALEKQDWSAAIAAYQQAIALNPNLPRTLSNLGVALHKTGDLDAAITYYQAALRQKPDFPEAHYNLGKALQEKGNFDAASDHYRRAIALNPTYAEPYYGLGSILAQSDTWDKLFTPQDHFEAIKSCYEQLLRVRPQEAAAYNNLGSAYFRRGKIAESVTYFEQAIAHDPHLSPAHRNLGLALLTQGDLVRGFAEYRWRWQVEGQGLPNFSQPQWDGSDLTGKTILLYPEQGHGDIIQFVRYAPLVAQRGGRVVVSCYAGLERLVASVAGVDQVVTHHKKVDFDTFFPLMDLPIIFKTDLATVPAQIPYLKAPAIPPLILQVPDHIRLKVGIVWAGNPQNPTDQKRSCPLIAFLPLLALKNIAFYSLQVGEPVTQLANLPDEIALLDLSPHLKDFADTAAVIEQLDLVITVDTAVAHLAGALGKSTWILLSALPDWRWLLDREDSPWYPTVRLFRQTRLGDWAEVMTRVVDTLAELRDTYTQPHPSKQVATIIAALTKQGNTYLKNKQWDAAITCFKKAIALQPNLPTVHYSLGWLYKQKLDLEWAEQYLRQAIALAPDLAEAHFTLGTTLLLRGDWLSGWEEYEWRFKTALFQKLSTAFLNVNKTCLTDRENIAGKRILICKEQGFGDQIQFFRYALLIGRLGGTAISVCSTELKSLFERAIYIVEPARADANIIVTDQPSIPISDFDEYISLMSLPKLFGTTPDSIPLPVPYLFAPEISSIHLKTTSLTLKIGIAWAGSSLNQENDKRSCTLTDLLSLLNLKNIDFYSLQVGPESQQLESLPPTVTVYDLSPQLQDFADTAAAIEQLDLVISVDTAVAHLTGAMAKPVWVLLAHLPDWRWLLDRDDSPWYPTMRLFRQTKPGDWASVMQRVKTALQEFLVQNSKFKIQSSLENTNSQTSIVIQPKVFEPSPSFTARCQPVTTIPETKIPKQLAIDWSMQLTSGWGVYGFNLALQLLRYKSCQPIALRPPLVCLEDLNPLYQRLLLPYFQSYQNIEQITSQHPGQTIGLGMPVLQALGNNFVGADRLQAFRGDRTIGVIFFENTHFTADALAIAQQYDWIIAGSHWNEAILRQHGLTRVSTVLQGIDPTYFHPAPRLHLFPDRFVIFSGGKLEYRKGQDIIVAAFKHFQQRHPDTLLITAWQTHWPQYMRGMEQTGNVIGLPEMGANRQLGIVPWLVRNGIPAEAVIDLGRVPNHQMPQILREADVAVFTNRAEGGTNLVAMECLATGLPTILSANTGHLDLIREDLQLDHCYVLRSQGPVRPNAHFPAVDGWGESAVEEVIAHLEAVYQNRAVAKGKGERAVQFMHILTWETQVQGLLATLSHLYP
ncbi:tetratricopeptide repeat protein [Trichothermofontia sp.]